MKRHLRWIVPLLVVALIAGGIAFAVTRPGPAAYTVATAERGTIEQDFRTSGTVSRPNASKQTFDTPATVTSVAVKVGDKVASGQTLATTDSSQQRTQLLQAQATLAQAQAALDADETAKSAADKASSAPASPAAAPPARATAPPSAPAAPSGPRTVTVTATVTVPASPASAAASQAARAVAQVQACNSAVQRLSRDQIAAGRAIATASAQFAAANRAAAARLQQAQSQMAKATQEAARQAIAQARAQLAAQAQRQLGAQITDGTLAADRARVVQARQQVDAAQRAVAATTMRSPLAGTVGAVDLRVGESSAGRSLTVVGAGQAEVDVQVPLNVRSLVSSGQSASVGLVGSDPALTGKVTSVTVLPASSSGSPSYTATIAAADPDGLLKAGSKAEVRLALRTVRDVVTVPLSAVTKTTDTAGTVQVVAAADATTAETVEVTTGATGGGRIEISSGLEPGRVVVLADRRLPVPGGMAQYQNARRGGTGDASPTPTPSR
ncbi:efflux RND transporter periplasmic adaptor subunit [Nigerium massiliense]|uniref:efflux RND transporter periplasmic adaptor subunit n=1 Tax=Nigerium massiliense TaxID=1522317 RepID=UPI0005909382|nr:biotin/lipoyl-binding protein [Nigerium massiliense]